MQTLWQDLRFGLRMLRKSPGFTAVIVLTLALGIGANSTVFSWINSILLNPIPGVEHTAEYAAVSLGHGFEDDGISYPDYCDLRDHNNSLSNLVAYALSSMYLTGNEKPEKIWGHYVTTNYFDAMELRPFLGRGFFPGEGMKPGAAPVAVMSYRLWQTHFGGDQQIVGKSIQINKHPYTVIGVAPPAFQGTTTGLSDDLWLPITMVQQSVNANAYKLEDRGATWLYSIGHLRRGVTRGQAQAELSTLYRQIAKQFPDSHKNNVALTLQPLWNAPMSFSSYFYRIFVLLMLICSVVLLLACVNVANLMLVRSVTRRRELGIRLSIGATRWRLVRQLLAESVLFALCGGAIAVLLTSWTAGTLVSLNPHANDLPVSITPRVDRTVLFATLAISLLTAVIFGVLPALRSSAVNPLVALKGESGSATAARRKTPLSSALVVAQIAISLAVLICAGLFIRSFRLQQQFNPGFNPHHVLLDTYTVSVVGYDKNSGIQFHRKVLAKLRALPGVESAALADWSPLGFDIDKTTVVAETYVPQPHESMEIGFTRVSPEYLRTMQIPLAAGREFTSSDTDKSQLVAMINQAFAVRYWPNRNAIGNRVQADGKWFTVVGVAHDSDTEHLGQKPKPFLYLPLFQDYDDYGIIHVRVAGNPLAYASAVQNAVHELDADLPLFNLMPLDARIALQSDNSRIGGVFVGAFGVLALIIAAVGVFGVTAYTTSQRTQEFGIRIALGAEPRAGLRLVLRQGAILAFLGTAIGLGASFMLTRGLSSVLFGVSAADPLTFAACAVLLIGVTLTACYIPARRAMRVDPIVALRNE